MNFVAGRHIVAWVSGLLWLIYVEFVGQGQVQHHRRYKVTFLARVKQWNWDN